jgi:hypothetical protein
MLRKSGSQGFAISPSSANQFPSHRPDEHHHGQQQPRRYLMPRPPALGSAPPAVQSAPRVETVGRSWSIARGTDAAQTVWNEAASPSPTDQDPPGMLGKRTTQALVAQGIEHRFPKRALAVTSPPSCTGNFPCSAWESAALISIFDVPLSPVKSSRLQRFADHTRTSWALRTARQRAAGLAGGPSAGCLRPM